MKTMVTFHAVCLLVLFVSGNGEGVEHETGKQLITEERLECGALREERACSEMKDEGASEERNFNSSARPNVILLLADDLGYGDLGISGHPTSRTPHIDKLATKSRIFTHFYVTSPVCSPSRASLLTGRFQVRSGVYPGTFVPENFLGLPPKETTIANLLRDKGYRTMIVGKWHLGVGTFGEYLPTNFGFDEYLGVPYSHDMCPCRQCFPENGPCHDLCWRRQVSCPLFSNATIVEQPVEQPYLTRRLLDHALRFVSDSAARNRSFFLYFPFHHVHHPQFASGEFHGGSARGVFGDALSELDWAVGKLTSALSRLNLLSSTLIWFTSDNGPSLLRHERGGCAGPLRCGKGSTWEGGVRVPAFVHWPPKISRGRTNGLVSALDVLPTLAAITQLNTSRLLLDGVDVSPLLWDPNAESPRKFFAIYPESPEEKRGPFAVTNGTFKAHFYTKGTPLSDAENYDLVCRPSHPLTHHDPPLLYNLHHDPGERYNLANNTQYGPVLEMLSQWRAEHMGNMTWIPGRTSSVDPRSQPCCTHPSCEPFPECCDCPSLAHPNHISSYNLHH